MSVVRRLTGSSRNLVCSSPASLGRSAVLAMLIVNAAASLARLQYLLSPLVLASNANESVYTVIHTN